MNEVCTQSGGCFAQVIPSKGAGSVELERQTTTMAFWVYILRCADNSYYTGHTDNLEERIAKHQIGETEGYTSTRLPVTLMFSEEFPTREEALKCERQITLLHKRHPRKSRRSVRFFGPVAAILGMCCQTQIRPAIV